MKFFTATIVAAISFAMVVHAGDADNKCMPLVRPCNKRGLDSRDYAYPMGGIVGYDDVKKVEATKDD
jgi:hypothetical protein